MNRRSLIAMLVFVAVAGLLAASTIFTVDQRSQVILSLIHI